MMSGWFRARYGAGVGHLTAMLVGFTISGYAAWFLLATDTLPTSTWFVASAVAHDVVLLPFYALLDAALVRIWRRQAGTASGPPHLWLNYVRYPAAISALLLLVFFPEISQRHTLLLADSDESTAPYLTHWLMVAGGLFALSALGFLARRARISRHRGRPVPSDSP